MMDYLVAWGPTLFILAVVIIVMRFAIARQARFFKTAAENSTAQTAEMRKVREALDRIATALEKR